MQITSTTSVTGMRLTVTASNHNPADHKNNPTSANAERDTLSISKSAKLHNQSKLGGIIDSLLKQKQNIIDSKNSLIERTTKNSSNMEIIKDQLQEFDKQLHTIDQQIARYTFEEQQKALGTDQPSAKKQDEPKTEQEIQNERLHAIVSLSGDVSQIEAVASTRSKMLGEARVLTKEIELDEARGTGQIASSKRDQLSKIEGRISDLNDKIGQALKDTAEQVKDHIDDGQHTEIKPSDQESEELSSGQFNGRTEKLASYKEIQKNQTEASDQPQLEIRV